MRVLLIICAFAVAAGNAHAATQPLCTVEPFTGTRRVRREISDLTDAEWANVVSAYWTMKNTSMADGQALYGSAFRNYDYFVVKHAVFGRDSRGDQAHFGEWFINSHAALALEMENSLLLIDPTIEGLPYWDVGRVGGHGFDGSPRGLGSAPGTGPHNTVIDGAFARWPINPEFNLADYTPYFRPLANVSQPFTGHESGMLRGDTPSNRLITPYVTRYGGHTTNVSEAGDGKLWGFSQAHEEACTEVAGSWGDWYECVDEKFGNSDFHTGLHKVVGGLQAIAAEDCQAAGCHDFVFGDVTGPVTLLSDLEDPNTSPNDPVFFFHHINLDRNRLEWTAKRAAAADSESVKGPYYGYIGTEGKCHGAPWYTGPAALDPLPWDGEGGYAEFCMSPGSDLMHPDCKKACPYAPGPDGTGADLGDVINGQFPFSKRGLLHSGAAADPAADAADLLTHADFICLFAPETAPYVYAKPGEFRAPVEDHKLRNLLLAVAGACTLVTACACAGIRMRAQPGFEEQVDEVEVEAAPAAS